ncbi:hypothetical protein [Arthrobacter flavus]|uniref:Uncharacterized protein n=1 Tax=Arthrobacter flavus TaxID=95172 RepID=A0ABW4Q677_9MICC
MSGWRRYDAQLVPAFYERFEERWGKGAAPFLDPVVGDEPQPRAQWINVDTGAAVAAIPIWGDDQSQRSFGVFYLPPQGDIWVLRPGHTAYLESSDATDDVSLRNDAFKKAVSFAKSFIYGDDA